MNFFLAISDADYGTRGWDMINSGRFGEVLAFGGEMLLIGMATVFSVLCILWLCLMLFKIVFHDIPEKRAAEAQKKAAAAEVTEVETAENNDEEIIAVIAAAVAAAESDKNGAKFRVVSFKRK